MAAIRMRYQKGGQQQESALQNVKTDDLGNFRLFGLAEGNYFVKVEGRNMQNGETSFRSAYYPGTPTIESAQKLKATAGTETSGVRFSVGTQSTYIITGSVIDNTDLPGPKRYNVSAVQIAAGANFASGGQTNPDGTFTLRGIPSGDYMLMARSNADRPAGANSGPERIRAISSSANIRARRWFESRIATRARMSKSMRAPK